MSEIILDSAIDSIKLLPFLFLTYLFMEWLEHKTGSAARNRIRTAGKLGPVWGGLLGVIPQCGFSAAASSLFFRSCDYCGNTDRSVSVYFR